MMWVPGFSWWAVGGEPDLVPMPPGKAPLIGWIPCGPAFRRDAGFDRRCKTMCQTFCDDRGVLGDIGRVVFNNLSLNGIVATGGRFRVRLGSAEIVRPLLDGQCNRPE